MVVQACSSRTPLIELVQRQLDSVFQNQIKQFSSAKSEDAVAALWRGAISGEDNNASLAGALWASLTHPRTDRALMTQIGHDIHMIQHRLGGETRRDNRALTQAKLLAAERLTELEAARAKLLLAQKQQAREAAAYHQQVVDAEAALVGAQAQNDALKLQLASLRQSVTQLDSREKLMQRVDDLAEQNSRLKQRLAESLDRREVALTQPAEPLSLDTNMDRNSVIPAPRTINLGNISVLCVGGRSGAVASYRKAVEGAGGKFMHHDGGIEHNHHRLDANLAAADCVVCQTACISHTAYWFVKDYCKKTGKQCVYLDKPSMSSFVEGLNTLPYVPESLLATG